MSFSLALQNGDLNLSGTSLGTVVNAAKLQQDLVCTLLTPLGFEELHPEFGSILEENLINPETTIIGTGDFNHAAAIVRSELLRICQNYQAQQIARNEDDAIKFGKPTLTSGEVLLRVININFISAEDHLLCKLTLEISNEELKISIPVSI
jgi:hypothetical protein